MSSLLQLEQNGFFVWDDFLSASELALIQEDFRQLHSEGKFNRAGIGKGADFHLNDAVRRDETLWWEQDQLSDAQKILWNKLETLKQEINQHFFLGLWEFEGHYAHYPVGGIYQAHLDRFSKDDARTISMVLYLNSDWKSTDGGELRIHSKNPDAPPTDLAPLGGRLVCFLSATTLHEVLPAKRSRFSFAGWWKNRPNRPSAPL